MIPAQSFSLIASVLMALILCGQPLAAAETNATQERGLILVARLPAGAVELESLLGSVGSQEAARILAALGARMEPSSHAIMTSCLKRDEPSVRQAALRALAGQTGLDENARNKIRALLADSDSSVRVSAIRCLSALGDRHDIPAIAARLRDERKVAEEAHAALIKISGHHIGKEETAWTTWYANNVEQSREALARIDALVHEGDGDVGAALSTLVLLDADIGEKRALLQSYVSSADPVLAARATQTLAALDPMRPRAPVSEESASAALVKPTAAPDTVMAGIVPGSLRTSSGAFVAYLIAAVVIGLIGALGLLVFMMRTREAAIRMTKRLTKRVMAGTRRVGKKGMNFTKRVTRAIKKKITFTR
jgi:hypothetical protein